MAKESENVKKNEYEGCYGEVLAPNEVKEFLLNIFKINEKSEEKGQARWSACNWGHRGVGKTAVAKQLADHPIIWRGKKYPGYKVISVPIAQFEEMGDLHGMPDRHVRITMGDAFRWVPEQVLGQWVKNGWEIDEKAGVTTRYAPPDWVPQEEGPCVLLLDDWNRASIRIIKGCMQLLQDYGMVSWQLPAGCNIVLTGNPDGGDYQVTSIDNAILTRIQSVTQRTDRAQWALWAQENGVDPKVINFILRYPEMLIGRERTSPRTIARFGQSLNYGWSSPTSKSNKVAEEDRWKYIIPLAKSLLDDETIAAMIAFFNTELEKIIDPEEILDSSDQTSINEKIDKLLPKGSKDQRTDIVSIILERLYIWIVQDDCKVTDQRVENFQKFIINPAIPDDMRFSILRRISTYSGNNKLAKNWLTSKNPKSPIYQELVKNLANCLS